MTDELESNFAGSRFITQRKIDPSSILPPYSLSVRDKSEKLRKDLTFPQSPAFVNIYKMNKETNLVQASDFCLQNNIPFNSEEHNYYRLRQTRQRFKQYSSSINQCFETARPDDFATGINLMSERDPRPPKNKVTENYTDGQLYIPNV